MYLLSYRFRLLFQYPRKALLPCLLLLMGMSNGAGQVPEFRVFTYRGGRQHNRKHLVLTYFI